jgi:hypothetical protein
MHGLTIRPDGLVRSAIMLAACTLAAALLLMPVALVHTGSNGPLGLMVAAACCLLSGLIAEAAASAMSRTAPTGAALVRMIVRMFVPLSVCVAILIIGQDGRDHLFFIAYLLTFYMVTLGLETWLAVKRSSGSSRNSNHSPR